uniref:Uncharacterized protein n=1 Tax=Arundo donax TaxID=35708 RepID=A0A0A9B5J3_ARUDO
MAARDLSAFQ